MRIVPLFITLALAAFVLCRQEASAEIVTKCSGAKGWSHYMYDSRLDTKVTDGDWVKEGMWGNGVFFLDKMRIGDKTVYRVLYQSETTEGQKKSLVDEGMSGITNITAENGNIIIWANNPKDSSLEHYTFKLDGNGKGRLVFALMNTAINNAPKASIFVAECMSI